MSNDTAYSKQWYERNREHALEVQRERRTLYPRSDGDVVAQRRRAALKTAGVA